MNENNSVVQRDSFQVCSKKRGGYLFEKIRNNYVYAVAVERNSFKSQVNVQQNNLGLK